jgi:hypothetical protein
MSQEELNEMMDKANKWDALDKEIAACYFDEEGNELEDDNGCDLVTIGEIAAIAFGYL